MRQYYFKDDHCKAEKASDPDCICWNDAGTGRYAHVEENASTTLTWRNKPTLSFRCPQDLSGTRSVVAKTEAVGRSQIRSFRNKETPPSREQVLEKENEYLKACVARLEELLFHKTYPKKL